MPTLLHPTPFVAAQALLDRLGATLPDLDARDADVVDAVTDAELHEERHRLEEERLRQEGERRALARLAPRVQRIRDLTAQGFDGTAWLEADALFGELVGGMLP